MSPAAPVIVHPSCVHTASIAVNALALVRATRKTPAFDSTSTAPPTSVSGEPETVACTPDPVNRPATRLSADAGLLGAVGDADSPPQADRASQSWRRMRPDRRLRKTSVE
jgi:hypothetical protein